MEYIPVGKLNKSFGTKGQIRVVPEKVFESDLKNNDVWFVSKGGEVVPYFVESIDESIHFLVKFEDVDSPEQAKKITGGHLMLRSKDVKVSNNQEDNDLDKLIGFSIVTSTNDKIGTITKIEEYPQQLMATAQKGNNEFLIPLLPEFIININTESHQIVMELPDGIVEAQLS